MHKREECAKLSCELRMRWENTRHSELLLDYSQDFSERGAEPVPVVVSDKVGWVGDERSVVCVELARLVRRTSPLPAWTHESIVCVELACLVRRTNPLPAWTHESRVCWVSCVLSWHVLSEGQVHYQRGHTSLECVECRVCWAGTSCQKDGSCTSHRSVTPCSWSCIAGYDSLGSCSPLCWSSSVLHVSSTPILHGWTSINVILLLASFAGTI